MEVSQRQDRGEHPEQVHHMVERSYVDPGKVNVKQQTRVLAGVAYLPGAELAPFESKRCLNCETCLRKTLRDSQNLWTQLESHRRRRTTERRPMPRLLGLLY